MARRASVRYWSSRGAYCCWFRGHQYTLAEGPDDFPSGPTYQKALDQFKALTALTDADQAKDLNPVRIVCELYLRHISTHRHSATLLRRKRVLVPFANAFGDVPVKDL